MLTSTFIYIAIWLTASMSVGCVVWLGLALRRQAQSGTGRAAQSCAFKGTPQGLLNFPR